MRALNCLSLSFSLSSANQPIDSSMLNASDGSTPPSLIQYQFANIQYVNLSILQGTVITQSLSPTTSTSTSTSAGPNSIFSSARAIFSRLFQGVSSAAKRDNPRHKEDVMVTQDSSTFSCTQAQINSGMVQAKPTSTQGYAPMFSMQVGYSFDPNSFNAPVYNGKSQGMNKFAAVVCCYAVVCASPCLLILLFSFCIGFICHILILNT